MRGGADGVSDDVGAESGGEPLDLRDDRRGGVARCSRWGRARRSIAGGCCQRIAWLGKIPLTDEDEWSLGHAAPHGGIFVQSPRRSITTGEVVPNSATSPANLAGGSTEEVDMPDSVYRVTDVIGVSSESWEAAARNAVQTAANTVRDLRVAEVVRQDVVIENGQVSGYRVRLALSFKYETGD